jgi:hypothetical protein
VFIRVHSQLPNEWIRPVSPQHPRPGTFHIPRQLPGFFAFQLTPALLQTSYTVPYDRIRTIHAAVSAIVALIAPGFSPA